MDFKDILKTLAPIAGSLIGGPLGGMALKTIADAIGVDDATQEKVAEAITGGKLNPEQIVALRQADDALKVRLEELGIKRDQMVYDDRKDARAMMVATRATTPAWLSWIIVAATMFLEGWVLIEGLPDKADPLIVGRVLGTLDVAFATVLAFWLGTSHQAQGRSSDRK